MGAGCDPVWRVKNLETFKSEKERMRPGARERERDERG